MNLICHHHVLTKLFGPILLFIFDKTLAGFVTFYFALSYDMYIGTPKGGAPIQYFMFWVVINMITSSNLD